MLNNLLTKISFYILFSEKELARGLKCSADGGKFKDCNQVVAFDPTRTIVEL